MMRGLDDETRRMMLGEQIDVQSSNVAWFRFFDAEELLQIGYKDGSVYQYEPVRREMALDLLRAGSKGIWIWDHLRVRGTVFGFQVPYSFLDGPSTVKRVWHEGVFGERDKKGRYLSKRAAGEASRKRHGAIPPSGEPFRGFHPAFAHQVGGMGKRRGSGAKKASRKKKGPF